MKTRPIDFSDSMVLAILKERKTQTRRIVNPQPTEGWRPHGYGDVHKMRDGEFILKNDEPIVVGWGASNEEGDEAYPCPCGKPGDRLWVREAFCYIKNKFARYRASNEKPFYLRWRPPISMPRYASRILLEITDVYIERLQDIGVSDAISEGVHEIHDIFSRWCAHKNAHREFANPIDAYRNIWESIHGPRSWDENPWVWVITFRESK